MYNKFFLVLGLAIFVATFNNSILTMGDDTDWLPEREFDSRKTENQINKSEFLKRMAWFLADEPTDKSNGNIENKEVNLEYEGQQIHKKAITLFDKKQLMCFGAGAVAIITVCGVTYVLYKKGRLKKIGSEIQQFVKAHKIGVASAAFTIVALCIASVYAKKELITFDEIYTYIMNLHTKIKYKAASN